MHRFYIPKSETRNNTFTLTGAKWHHCQTVLRDKQGNHITLFDGEGTEYLTEITAARKQGAELKILQKTTIPLPPYSITLAQALPRNKVMDFIIQKATELGVRKIIPVLSERSVVKLDPDDAKSKTERWREISVEAAKQCGLNWLPKIETPKSVKEIIELRKNFRTGFIGSLQPDSKPIWKYLTASETSKGDILLMIGPEGDFTPAEIGLARSAAFHPISLGPLVLRCDTAAIYAVSTISYEITRLSHQFT